MVLSKGVAKGSVAVLKNFWPMAELMSSGWSFASAGVVAKVNVGAAGGAAAAAPA